MRQFEEEIRLLQKDIQDKFLEDFEYDQQKMRKDLEIDMHEYWEIEHGKIAEQFSARNDIDKNNEIRRKINAVEVEQLVYQQTLKRKLEEVRFQMKKDLNSQIEVMPFLLIVVAYDDLVNKRARSGKRAAHCKGYRKAWLSN